MPALCRALLAGVPLHLEHPVEGLHRHAEGWQLVVKGEALHSRFDAVVLALPPAQAAVLLNPHLPLWAAKARQQLMLPGWVLMGVTDGPAAVDTVPPGADALPAPAPTVRLNAAPWQVAWPTRGPLGCIVRTPVQGQASATAWVVHAHADWSQTHLEASAEQVLPMLQQALAQFLNQPQHQALAPAPTPTPTPAQPKAQTPIEPADAPLQWRAAQAHRWRYAVVPSQTPAVEGHCWFSHELALGACGDYLGGGGVEGAWLSGQALAQTLSTALA